MEAVEEEKLHFPPFKVVKCLTEALSRKLPQLICGRFWICSTFEFC